jgi:hypothetical protein
VKAPAEAGARPPGQEASTDSIPGGMRVAGRDDHLEQLHLSILELVEVFGVAPRKVRRYVNTTLRGGIPAAIRDRAGENPEGPGGYCLVQSGGGSTPYERSDNGSRSEADAALSVR